MSDELLRQITMGHEGFNRGDLSEAKTNVAEDVEWTTTGTWPGLDGTYRGAGALDQWMETIKAEWETFQVSLADVIRDEGEMVVVTELLSGRGRESGIEVEMRVHSVYWSEAGRIVRRHGFATPEEALAAAGIEAG